MNVTTIGFPFAAPAPQGGAADAGTGAGFAGLLGTVAGDGAAGQPTFGMPGAPMLGMPQIGAQTNAPLLPSALDPATALPGDKPQVAMAQLLATAAPSAVTPPVATGGNPLADAIAKALANAQGTGTDAATTGDTPAVPAETGATPAKAAATPSQPGPTEPGQGSAETKPGTTDLPIAATDAALPTAPAAPAAPQPAVAGKPVAKPARTEASDDAGLDPAGAPLPAPQQANVALAVQPVAVPVAQPQPVAQPAAQQPAAQGKTSGVQAPRSGKIDTVAANDTAPAQSTHDKIADLAQAIGPHGQSGGDASAQGDSKQQAFGQQLASVDARQAGAAAMAGTAPFNAMPATTASPASEPVLHARPGELGRNLGVEIARKVDAGEDTLRVRLNPAELGRVEVTLAFDDKGRVQATMRAESEHALNLLRQDAPDLGRALDQAGIRNDAASFRFESRDGGSGGSGNGQSAFQQQSRGGNQQFQDEPEIQTAAYRSVRSDGQVDLIA
ncbi:flagellar hook-length control protein FliK [Sphingomonas sp. TDK1]|uniref:flagellar hook-length control protein FliK n=1 Tax=Sphingomonas sp. TDK1 TaxID=453247 RepID=UPI0007DA3D4E|nr:flagellar hook-length control protein FliK [Sphingomonas sp. TDK1]OAN57296.1 hypothetical protein A7X12_08800 [Sphingomonas sp. TDK1]